MSLLRKQRPSWHQPLGFRWDERNLEGMVRLSKRDWYPTDSVS